MFVRQKQNKSGSTSVAIITKEKGRYKLVRTVGCSCDPHEIKKFYRQGIEWIRQQSGMSDMFSDTDGRKRELAETERFISNIENILVNGDRLVLNRIFDRIGFGSIDDEIFRTLVVSRLLCPSSKAATMEYLLTSTMRHPKIFSKNFHQIVFNRFVFRSQYHCFSQCFSAYWYFIHHFSGRTKMV